MAVFDDAMAMTATAGMPMQQGSLVPAAVSAELVWRVFHQKGHAASCSRPS